MLINVSIKLFFAIKAVLQQRLKQDKDGVSLDLSRWLKKGKMSYTSVNFLTDIVFALHGEVILTMTGLQY